MKAKTVYQALDDKDNPDYIENNDPFKCTYYNGNVLMTFCF